MDQITAGKIYDILVEHAGAPEEERKCFVFAQAQTNGLAPIEWRFCGLLGFGGKFWNNGGYYITYYREDETQQRKIIKKKVNTLLEKLYKKS